MNRFLYVCLIFFMLTNIVQAEIEKKKFVIIVGTYDSINVARALKNLRNMQIAEKYDFIFYTEHEIRSGKVETSQINDADIILADFMKRAFDKFLSENIEKKHPKIYSMRCAYLADKLKAKGLVPDMKTENYCSSCTSENMENLILFILSDQGENVKYDPPFTLPESGLFHPDSPEIFTSYEKYINWYKKTNNFSETGFWVGITTFSSAASSLNLKDRGKLEARLIRVLEKNSINVLPVFASPPYYKSLGKYFLDENQKSRVQAVCGFSFRFLRGFPQETSLVLSKINAPVFMPLEAHAITLSQWEKSDTGISPLRTAWQVCIPEINGAIEPTIVGGKTPARLKGTNELVYDTIPLPEHIDFLVKRIKAWHNLRVKPEKDKKIAVFYWNHPPGKQGIGGSYMNCFRSIAVILEAMKKQGYTIAQHNINEENIKKHILLSGRNVGSWASGELDALIAAGDALQISVSKYKEWFSLLPQNFQKKVILQWGQPEHSNIMIKNGNIIIPMVNLGNIILMPQPARGFGEDPEKLYHDPKIYPHHQYIAFYLWLKKVFKADAIISLGKHGTHEWLPGKQTGLSMSCPPEVLISDIPNIYPYIVDNVGEGIQAKRRGRGVIIDHLIPALKKGGTYMEYRKLTAMIDEYHTAQTTDASLAREKLKSVQKIILEMGIDKDLGLKNINDDAVEKTEHYILELQEELIPYGNHTFGVSPSGDSLNDLVEAVCNLSPEIKTQDMKSRIMACGSNEIDSLIHALSGDYIAPAEGNDPVRNPDAVPTGKNFYGFNADKVPSKEAFLMGKKLADDMILKYKNKNGIYPDKLGIILWSTELQRNEGATVASALHLLGITPVWDKKDQVTDIIPIPGSMLKRPRIDVLLQCSGLFRDSFPQLMKLLDRAVVMAGSLKDVENFVALNSAKVEQTLLEKGYLPEDAKKLSKTRVFGPMPGAYSHAVQELVPNSGIWEDSQEIADVFIHHYSFAYGEKLWGRPLKSAYKSNLKDIKITMHSRSSNLYNMLDNDDMFAFLGGLSLAVKSQAGQYPDVLVANMQDGKNINLEDLPKAIGKALRTRYLNPKWIQGMKKEGYSGAKIMDEFVEYLWGFQVTTPFAVDKTYWEEIHDVYITDKYNQDLKKFFDQNNPWALQSISARMLEADRKKYWNAPEDMKKNLAKVYAQSVIEKGVACCEHTCNNPMLQKFVTNIISLYGLLTPKQLDQFKTIISKATGKTQAENEAQREKIRESLKDTLEQIKKEENVSSQNQGKKIEGYEIIEENQEDTQITASGSEWIVIVIVIVILVILLTGWKRKKI